MIQLFKLRSLIECMGAKGCAAFVMWNVPTYAATVMMACDKAGCLLPHVVDISPGIDKGMLCMSTCLCAAWLYTQLMTGLHGTSLWLVRHMSLGLRVHNKSGNIPGTHMWPIVHTCLVALREGSTLNTFRMARLGDGGA